MNEINWDVWKFLIGEWVGEGGGEPGQGTGVFTFQLDLQKRVLVRRNRVEFADPNAIHEDLLIIYQQSDQPVEAIYFDNEGHVIRYGVNFLPDQNIVTFVSEPSTSAPRFRLTYLKQANESLLIRFEFSPPGQPEHFSVYTEGTARRK